MHFLICLIFGLLLLAAGSAELPVSPYRVLLAIGLVTSSPIFLAWLQGIELVRNRRLVGRQVQLEKKALGQADVIHFAAWACASLAGVWLMQWPTLVKVTWGLEGWILLDELLVIAPASLSLLASWVIFESTIRPLQDDEECRSPQPACKRGVLHRLLAQWPVSVYKFQHSLGLALLPLLLVFAVRDLFGDENASVTSVLLAGLVGMLSVVLLYPFYLKWLLPSEPLSLPSNTAEFAGCRLRQWHSGMRVYNALIAGLVPGSQTIFVSDGLVKHFPENEIAAIIRHELAHGRRGHLLLRSLALLTPLLALLTCSLCGLVAWNTLLTFGTRPNLTELLLLGAGMVIWTWGAVRPLSHWIEYDADTQATLLPETRVFCPQRARDLESALLRLGHGFPEQFSRSSLLHPSLESRLLRLRGKLSSHTSREKSPAQEVGQQAF